MIIDSTCESKEIDMEILNLLELKEKEYSNLSTLIGIKEKVLIDLRLLDVLIQECSDVVYEIGRIRRFQKESILSQYRYTIPFALVFLFMLVSIFRPFMKRFSKIRKKQ